MKALKLNLALICFELKATEYFSPPYRFLYYSLCSFHNLRLLSIFTFSQLEKCNSDWMHTLILRWSNGCQKFKRSETQEGRWNNEKERGKVFLFFFQHFLILFISNLCVCIDVIAIPRSYFSYAFRGCDGRKRIVVTLFSLCFVLSVWNIHETRELICLSWSVLSRNK